MPATRRSLSFVLVCTGLLLGGPAASAPVTGRLGEWTTIENERYGFSIAYPGSVFTPKNSAAKAEGQLLVSHDGNARLLVGGFDNGEQLSLRAYREHLLKRNYAGASIDYAPMRRNWFVVSGERDGVMFYERVSFTCDGKFITSWAMLYPVAERRFYDRVVEAVAPTFTPGRGPDCD